MPKAVVLDKTFPKTLDFDAKVLYSEITKTITKRQTAEVSKLRAQISPIKQAGSSRKQSMVSIKDIAKRCGVSVATVSKALNSHTDISAATRERVLATANEMGYVPNPAARALKTNRTYNIGVLLEDERQSGLRHEFFAALLSSFKSEAESRGYDITFIHHNIGTRRASYLEHCRHRSVDGVIIACIPFDDPEVMELVQSELPTVTIDHVFNNRSAVLSDNVEGVCALVDRLCALGHERIAYIHGEKHSPVTEKRLIGFYRSCEAHGISVPDAYVIPSVYRDPITCAEATRQLLALPQRPTAILFPDDFSAVGGIQALRAAGLRIPEDISIAGYDGSPLSQVMAPVLTTYQQDTDAMGRTAAQRLIQQIESPRSTLPEQVQISGQLLEGASTAPPLR